MVSGRFSLHPAPLETSRQVLLDFKRRLGRLRRNAVVDFDGDLVHGQVAGAARDVLVIPWFSRSIEGDRPGDID